MKSKKLTALILSRRDFSESDRILSVFTLEEGRTEILAKGSRKIKSKMAGYIEPFTLGTYHIVEGKTFYILTGAETIECHDNICENINLYQNASYLCEILKLSIPESEPEKKIFNLLTDSLKILPTLNERKTEILKRYYEFTILSEIGYKPDFIYCKKCKTEILESDKYLGTIEGIFCPDCKGNGSEISKNSLKLLKLFQEKSLIEVLNISVSNDNISELKEVIYPYLCDILPRLPKSEVF